ncbi:pantothenate synthetase [Thermogemmatispora aurantia]|uniref:pantoate--beta-alanine ligase (AMP-forming) n=1 Tax=Thermogemmatispora aurantia TaxID=2045279 RepID=A0A5J4KEF1_9CHLR|nr:pantoate--beta-alanine ligase [Thermogemmatispora aurantia]GER85685.1 pantothenate synthetase [Thermogemmatispora aurantia]
MRVIHELWEMTETARGWLSGGTVALVPTQGSLHPGHLALIEAARRECEICVVSFFADPLQFTSPEELARHAHEQGGSEHKLRLLERLGVDVVFAPEREAMYPADFATYVTPAGVLAECLEARLYPQRLQAMATTACKLLLLVRPDIAYVLRNEVYTVALMRRLVRDLNIDVNISVLPEQRDAGGLAYSENYSLLTADERLVARVVYSSLLTGLGLLLAGERRPEAVTQAMEQVIKAEPLATLEYVALCDPDSLAALAGIEDRALLLAAVRIGGVRLLDSLLWSQERPAAG